MYHRVTNPENEPIPQLPGMYVRPETFRKHLEYLTKYFKVIPLEELIKNYSNKYTTKEKFIALTFDDAWIDFKTNALPLLEEFDVPATVFVPTKFIDSGEFFWNDIVQLAISQGIEIGTKDSTITDTIESLKLDKIRREALVKELKLKLGPALNKVAPQFLSWADIQEINSKGLISFGSHSHSHEISTQIGGQELKNDIETSVQHFIDHSVPMSNIFCYPNQSRDKSTDKVVKELYFISSLGQINEPMENVYARIGVHEDISAEKNLFKLTLGV